ncbi:hypothetical protein DRE_04416 [Drechslerella stenobrocha 248]|uniref:UBC core domain-containing protein n=1 Tax=Drechslerella stenobrocha 248 TaxID=1043628 RepID=W7IB00_9PEZI|nr:hypothetical protein DRE_04416 [Drechslerella stenobrocha 248]
MRTSRHRSGLIRAAPNSSAASQQTASRLGSSQATPTPGAARQSSSPTGSIYIRFITPEDALVPKLSGIPALKDPISLSTTVLALKGFVKAKVFGQAQNAPYTVDLHLPAHPILSTEHLNHTLYDYGLVGTERAPLDLFVVLRYTGVIGIAPGHFGEDVKSTSNCSAWHPVEGTTKAGISAFCASLEIIKRKVTDGATQRRFLTALWQTTHFLPAVYAMSSLFDSRTLTAEEKAALAQTFQALCMKSVPDWATGGKPQNVLEGSRQLLGWLLDQVTALKRGGSGMESWTRKAIIKRATAGGPSGRRGRPATPENDIVSLKLQNGESVNVTVEFLDKSSQTYPDTRQLVLSFRDNYSFDGTSYLVLPKDAGKMLDHRILHHPTPDGFFEQIINTTNLPTLCTVAPLSLSGSRPPVLTLNDKGLISVFEFGGECATEWARIWNPVTGVQLLLSNDQGQALAKTLKGVIQTRKLTGAWPLDGWDIGCLNASTVDTRKPKEVVMICIDCSSSMFCPAYGNEDVGLMSHERLNRMTAAKILFKNYSATASNYKLPVWFGVMRFDDYATTMQEPTPLLEEVEPMIEKLYPANMTSMWDCIYQAGEQLIDFREDNPDTKLRIIVLTDGMDNTSTRTDMETYSLLWENDIVLDAIVIGCGCDYESLFKICRVTGGYAMKPTSTSEIIQIAEMETMVDQTFRPPIQRHPFLPMFDAIEPLEPFTVNAFDFPETRNHSHQDDEFMSLANAHKVFCKNKQFLEDRGAIRAVADVVKNRRMLIEIKDMAENPHPDMDVYISESEMSFWKIVIQGPEGTSYENGTFVMFLDMIDDFPRQAPQARFITPIIHPNVNKHGRVCHGILDQDWKAETRVRDILCCIYGLLMVPEHNEPVDAIATLKYWTQDEDLYSAEIAQHIKKFASTSRKDWAHRIVPDLDAIPGVTPVKTTSVINKHPVIVAADTGSSSTPPAVAFNRRPIRLAQPPFETGPSPSEATASTSSVVEQVVKQASATGAKGGRKKRKGPNRPGSVVRPAALQLPTSPTLSAMSSGIMTPVSNSSSTLYTPRSVSMPMGMGTSFPARPAGRVGPEPGEWVSVPLKLPVFGKRGQ